tara:strand:+ start:403 stop:522 length:120 start_codon:yes stop_codon:yes gene_type:complete
VLSAEINGFIYNPFRYKKLSAAINSSLKDYKKIPEQTYG